MADARVTITPEGGEPQVLHRGADGVHRAVVTAARQFGKGATLADLQSILFGVASGEITRASVRASRERERMRLPQLSPTLQRLHDQTARVVAARGWPPYPAPQPHPLDPRTPTIRQAIATVMASTHQENR